MVYPTPKPIRKKEKGIWKRLFNKDQMLNQSMVLPGILWYAIFCYIPMYGIIIAFKEYKPKLGILGSEFVGLKQFFALFADPDVPSIIFNTVAIGVLKLLVCFPLPILFALLLNELHRPRLKRIVQTVSYFPYFISWVVVAMICKFLLDPQLGMVNYFLKTFGLIDKPLTLLLRADAYYGIAVATTAWKETGWSSIIFLAAITSIDPALYEAAMIDGANKMQRMIHITLPSITGTIILMFMLQFSGIFTGGSGTFDQSFFLGNPMNYDRSYVLSYYTLKMGVMQGRFSYATAVGLINSIVSFILLMGSNWACKRFTGRSLYMESDF